MASPTFAKISETELTLANPEEDVRGRTVLDRHGDEIGTVNDLLIEQEGEPRVRLLEVGSGGILGIGEATVLIPVEAVTDVTAERVRVDRTSERMREAPRYDPEIVRDENYYRNLYIWWETTPYWVPDSLDPTRMRPPGDEDDRGESGRRHGA